MDTGQYLRMRRRERGISLRDLAAKVGVSPAYLSRVEAGKVPASEALLRAVAAPLGEPPETPLLLAGRLPDAWRATVASDPEAVVPLLRKALDESRELLDQQQKAMQSAPDGRRAIEDESFPFEALSEVAEAESWRKELNRPIYHLHKWWAQRLGSVFRAILLGVFSPSGSDILRAFYEPSRLAGVTVFDPFMGSGTTIGEALKLGARAIGRDINPVAYFAVRNALTRHSRDDVMAMFHRLEEEVAPEILRWYRGCLADGTVVNVLYYFWVKVAPCPGCGRAVDLFRTYVFTRHASTGRHAPVRAVCPHCGGVNTMSPATQRVSCGTCGARYNPHRGPTHRTTATCPACQRRFQIAKALRETRRPPDHRLYAKMVLLPNGDKEYLAADEHDLRLYAEAEQVLAGRKPSYPVVEIRPGYNTDQVLNYGYAFWHHMFNARQLLALSTLADGIRRIPEQPLRDLFGCLFSGVLEFNSMFASFKGEGTGAVRHMFSHHILKPERMPLEANLWGTPRSSGSFSTLFVSRLLRCLDYAERPFELQVVYSGGKKKTRKVYGLSGPIPREIANTFDEFGKQRPLYLSCGDSSRTDLPTGSVDAVVTDPPFFDNVHYSQLADYFYVWQRQICDQRESWGSETTRSDREVQHSDSGEFTQRLTAVWRECHRVLQADGLLVFTYHHSRAEGWRAVLRALMAAGFAVTAAHPVKSEMSVAAPKSQARDPIDLDVILVCRKKAAVDAERRDAGGPLHQAQEVARRHVERFNAAGRPLGKNDVRVILSAQLLVCLSRLREVNKATAMLDEINDRVEKAIVHLHAAQDTRRRRRKSEVQMRLLLPASDD